MPRWKSSREALDFQRGPNDDEIAFGSATGGEKLALTTRGGTRSTLSPPPSIVTHMPVRSHCVCSPHPCANVEHTTPTTRPALMEASIRSAQALRVNQPPPWR